MKRRKVIKVSVDKFINKGIRKYIKQNIWGSKKINKWNIYMDILI